MAAQFVPVTEAEMDAFLVPQGFKVLPLDNCKEIVYGKVVKASNGFILPLCLRVFTGILKGNGQSRGVGEDAIRVCLVVRRPDGEIRGMAKEKRVHRVLGWKANLADRLEKWEENMPDKACPNCGLPMVRRKSKHGEFFGCTGFPECKQTARVE